MAYKLSEHKQLPNNTRYMKILVNPEVETAYLTAKSEYDTALAAYEALSDEEKKQVTSPVEPKDPRIFREFRWGMDVPLAQVKKETKALLDLEFAQSEVQLSGVGAEL